MKGRLGKLSPAEYLHRHGPLVVRKRYEKPAEISWDDETYRGDAYGAYAWGCDVVELEVDEVTHEVRPLRLTAVQEIGRAIHPGLARGQACSLNRARLMSLGMGATIEAEFAGGQISAPPEGRARYGATTVRPLYPSFPADLWENPKP